MNARSTAAACLAVAALLLSVSFCSAQFPLQMNYQVMLTDDLDQPLASQLVHFVFRIYEQEFGGSVFWSETQDVTTNSIGVVSVALGSVNPLAFWSFGPLWLEVEVDGQVMEPRRQLMESAYAKVAMMADDANNLDGLPASSYALYSDLASPGAINNPANPLEWTKLKNVPSGFADGTDDVGTGVGGSGTTNYVSKFTGSATIGNSGIYETGGQVGIGTTTTAGKLTVESAADEVGLSVTNTATSASSTVLLLEKTEDLHSLGVMARLNAPETSDQGLFIQCNRNTPSSGWTAFYVAMDGFVSSRGLWANSYDERQSTVEVYNAYPATTARTIDAHFDSYGSHDGVAVYGESKRVDFYGIGGQFVGGYVGAEGQVEPTGSGVYYGLRGYVQGGSGTNYGVYGNALNGVANYGIRGDASGGVTSYGVYGSAGFGSSENWAGYFNGDARVTGTFTNPGPVLEIDHPADPENSYLRHALVASPEMKTVYDGTVVLDAGGEALVELPEWFETLNSNFRYQLTPIGAPAPGLYVAKTVGNGSFSIAGGEPGTSVSWQVTGVRQDAHARHRPLIVEEEKRPDDRGHYLSPEAHGASKEAGIGHLEEKKKHD